MRLAPLAKAQHQIKLGQPLPFGIRDAGGRLLLARGFPLADQEQLDALLERGAFVDLDELQGPRAEILKAPPERLPGLWHALIGRVDAALHAPPSATWVQALEEHARTLHTLVERSADIAIFMIVRQDGPERCHYGVLHAVHAAATGALVARRLGWDEPRTQTLMRAALTMNLAIIDLQGRLADQAQAPTAMQRQAIRQHPEKSAAMLRAVGVADAAWLAAVEQHHEVAGGGGYPRGLQQADELAEALHVCDVFTAKFGARRTRPAMPGNQAARTLFTAFPKSPVTAAVVKEFGVFPPGCLVALHNGEMGVVVKRGAAANTPLVDVLMGRNGEATLAPVRRDTAHNGHGIAATVGPERMMARVAPERLYAGDRDV